MQTFFQLGKYTDADGKYIKSADGVIILKDEDELKMRLKNMIKNDFPTARYLDLLVPEAIILKNGSPLKGITGERIDLFA